MAPALVGMSEEFQEEVRKLALSRLRTLLLPRLWIRAFRQQQERIFEGVTFEKTATFADAVAESPLLSPWPEACLAELERCGRRYRCVGGRVVTDDGATSTNSGVWVLLSGSVDILKRVAARDKGYSSTKHVATVGAPKVMGAFSCLTGQGRSVSVRASGPCEFVVLPRRDVRRLMDDLPDAAKAAVAAAVEKRYEERSERKMQNKTGLRKGLAKCFVFAEIGRLDASALEAVTNNLTQAYYRHDSTLITAGAPCDTVILLTKGQLCAHFDAAPGGVGGGTSTYSDRVHGTSGTAVSLSGLGGGNNSARRGSSVANSPSSRTQGGAGGPLSTTGGGGSHHALKRPLLAGAVLGGACLVPHTWHVTITVTQSCEVWTIGKAKLQQILQRRRIYYKMLHMSRRVLTQQDRVERDALVAPHIPLSAVGVDMKNVGDILFPEQQGMHHVRAARQRYLRQVFNTKYTPRIPRTIPALAKSPYTFFKDGGGVGGGGGRSSIAYDDTRFDAAVDAGSPSVASPLSARDRDRDHSRWGHGVELMLNGVDVDGSLELAAEPSGLSDGRGLGPPQNPPQFHSRRASVVRACVRARSTKMRNYFFFGHDGGGGGVAVNGTRTRSGKGDNLCREGLGRVSQLTGYHGKVTSSPAAVATAKASSSSLGATWDHGTYQHHASSALGLQHKQGSLRLGLRAAASAMQLAPMQVRKVSSGVLSTSRTVSPRSTKRHRFVDSPRGGGNAFETASAFRDVSPPPQPEWSGASSATPDADPALVVSASNPFASTQDTTLVVTPIEMLHRQPQQQPQDGDAPACEVAVAVSPTAAADDDDGAAAAGERENAATTPTSALSLTTTADKFRKRASLVTESATPRSRRVSGVEWDRDGREAVTAAVLPTSAAKRASADQQGAAAAQTLAPLRKGRAGGAPAGLAGSGSSPQHSGAAAGLRPTLARCVSPDAAAKASPGPRHAAGGGAAAANAVRSPLRLPLTPGVAAVKRRFDPDRLLLKARQALTDLTRKQAGQAFLHTHALANLTASPRTVAATRPSQ